MIRIDFKFIVFIILAYAYAYFQGRVFSYSIFYLFALVFVAAIIANIIFNLSLAIKVQSENNIYNCGDKGQFKLTITNKLLFPIPYILIKGELINLYNPKIYGEALNLTSFQCKNYSYAISFKKRGSYEIGKFNISFRDLLGIVRSEKNIDKDYRIKIYPRVYDSLNFIIPGSDLFNNHLNRKNVIEDMYSVKDMRLYRDGDNLKRINWKISAKCNELYVRNFENASGKHFNLILDMNVENYNMDVEGIFEEKIVDFSVSLIKYMVDRSIKVNLLINSKVSEERTIETKDDFRTLMEYFVEQKSDSDIKISRFINMNFHRFNGKGSIIIVTGKITKEIQDTIMLLQDNSYEVCLFYVNATENGEEIKVALKNMKVQCYSIFDFLRAEKTI